MTTYSDMLRLAKQQLGENKTIWGDVLNDMIQMVDDSIAGVADVDVSTLSVALSDLDGQTCESRMMCLNLSGTPANDVELIVPRRQKLYCVVNGTAKTVTVKTSSGSGADILAGENRFVVVDETLNQVFSMIAAGVDTTLSEGGYSNAFSWHVIDDAASGSYTGYWQQEGDLLAMSLTDWGAAVDIVVDSPLFDITTEVTVPGLGEIQQRLHWYVYEDGAPIDTFVYFQVGIALIKANGDDWVVGSTRRFVLPNLIVNTASDYD